MKSWYSIQAKAESAVTEISIFDEIGYWGISAKQFIGDLKNIPANHKILLRIHSPGGEVFDGNAIANALKRHPAGYEVQIEGLAASMATVISLGGSPVKMAANGFYMIHNPWGVVMGDAENMRDQAILLDKIQAGIVNAYVAKSGKTSEEVQKWMDAETWFTAEEALAAGFVDEITDAVKIAACVNGLGKFKNAPQNLTTQETVMEDITKPKASGSTLLMHDGQKAEWVEVQDNEAPPVEVAEEIAIAEEVTPAAPVEEVHETPVAVIAGAESIIAKFNDLQTRFNAVTQERDFAVSALAQERLALDRLERSLGVAAAKVIPAVEVQDSTEPDISALVGYEKVKAAFSKIK